MQSATKMLRLSFTGRAECLRDINLFMSDVLGEEAVCRFVYAYSAENTELYEGSVTLEFQCCAPRRDEMRGAVAMMLKKLALRSKTDDLHVLRDTLHFSDEYTGDRTEDRLQERIMNRLTDKLA
jgi:hypothetical protein